MNWYPKSKVNVFFIKHPVKYCPDCNKPILRRRKYCAQCSTNRYKAQQRHKDTIRRIREKDTQYEYIDSLIVFERDNWLCKLCGIRTSESLMGKDSDMAPTLDHIIPISKGGSHTYSNVQLIKRDKILKRYLPNLGINIQ